MLQPQPTLYLCFPLKISHANNFEFEDMNLYTVFCTGKFFLHKHTFIYQVSIPQLWEEQHVFLYSVIQPYVKK